ncbi:MAG: VWA domain-containing protein [Acidobacteria bacterium]|nr:VWA domain-containing protein [Acidobacteriota bacterium]
MGTRMTSAIVVAALAVGVATLAAQQQPLFRSGTELVDLYVTVTDRSGRLVPDLTRDDFVVFDNGQPQELILFENEVRPITVVVMLDTSASVTPSLNLLKAGAEQFLIRLLPDDRGRVGAFNDKIQVEPAEFTGDRDALIDSLGVLDFGNPTRLYDGVAAGLDALIGVDGRRVVLVFTDGDDTSSETKSGDVLDRAIAEEVMIYSIGLEADYFNGVRRVRTRPDRNLRRFAEETGGGYFELEETSDLGPTFTRVAQELHSQYVLGFAPQDRDGRVHELEVRLKPRGMRARARRSYVAPSDSAAPRARR